MPGGGRGGWKEGSRSCFRKVLGWNVGVGRGIGGLIWREWVGFWVEGRVVLRRKLEKYFP